MLWPHANKQNKVTWHSCGVCSSFMQQRQGIPTEPDKIRVTQSYQSWMCLPGIHRTEPVYSPVRSDILLSSRSRKGFFSLWFWGFNPGPCAWEASTLPTELYPQPGKGFLCFQMTILNFWSQENWGINGEMNVSCLRCKKTEGRWEVESELSDHCMIL